MAQQSFNVMIIGQAGRLQYEALLFAASLRHSSPGFSGRLFVAVPQPGPLWQKDPSIHNAGVLEALARLNVEILPFESKLFGQAYPYGNKIEALHALPEGEPFVFFDSDFFVFNGCCVFVFTVVSGLLAVYESYIRESKSTVVILIVGGVLYRW